MRNDIHRPVLEEVTSMTVRTFYPPNANVNALTICNACDSRPMLPSQEGPSAPGYCQECLDEVLAEIEKGTTP